MPGSEFKYQSAKGKLTLQSSKDFNQLRWQRGAIDEPSLVFHFEMQLCPLHFEL